MAKVQELSEWSNLKLYIYMKTQSIGYCFERVQRLKQVIDDGYSDSLERDNEVFANLNQRCAQMQADINSAEQYIIPITCYN